MNVMLLPMHDIKLTHYSSEPERTIPFLLEYQQSTLIMEPGELADFAIGQKFLMNSPSTIIVLDKGEHFMARQGDYFHIYMPVDITNELIITELNNKVMGVPARKIVPST